MYRKASRYNCTCNYMYTSSFFILCSISCSPYADRILKKFPAPHIRLSGPALSPTEKPDSAHNSEAV